MKKTIIIFMCLFLFACLPLAQAQWLQDGELVTASEYAKTKGEFGAMLFFTDKPNELFEAWNQDVDPVTINEVEEIEPNKPLVALIVVSNCTPDSNGMANVTTKFTVIDPEGKIKIKTDELEVWVNKPAPPKQILELSVDHLAITVEKKELTGFYTVKALVHDKNSDTKINLERKFKVLGDVQNEYIWAEIIYRPRAKKNDVVPRSTKGFRHMAIVSDVLPHGIWEMGPDSKGMIITTNTVKDLAAWHTNMVTQKCIELGGEYIHSAFVEVNKKGLLDAIKLYEESFSGKEKYSFRSYNENYAVETVIYGAGGDIRKAKKIPPDH